MCLTLRTKWLSKVVEAPGVEGRGQASDFERLDAVWNKNVPNTAGSDHFPEGPGPVSDGLVQVQCSGVVDPGDGEAIRLEADGQTAVSADATVLVPAEHPRLAALDHLLVATDALLGAGDLNEARQVLRQARSVLARLRAESSVCGP